MGGPSSYDIRDPDDARRHVLQGLLLSRSAPLTAAVVDSALAWSVEIISDGSPLPPVGFVADVGQIALGTLRGADLSQLPSIEGLEHTISRRYEDYVLGKMYADMGFERAGDALLRFTGRDRQRGVAYMVNQQRIRCGFGGVILSPAVIKSLQSLPAEEVCEQAWQCLDEEGLSPQLLADFQSLIDAVRNTGELLGAEDIFELESGTALAEFGQRLALRQVLQMSTLLKRDLPKQKPRSQARQYSVASNILEEDHYPIGGFTSISNKGTVESMVRSELAYIDHDMRPDLFDIKYARNELLYYSRDENQFLRRRLSYLFLLHPDLIHARLKDQEIPCQRIILLLACLYVSVGQLIDWMSSDAIHFEFLFVRSSSDAALDDERTLLETLVRDEIAAGVASVQTINEEDIEPHCLARARTSMCHTLSVGCGELAPPDDLSIACQLRVDGPVAKLFYPDGTASVSEDSGLEGWKDQLQKLLRFWV